MRVLFLIDSLAPGGTERSTLVLASRLAGIGVEPTITTLRAAEHDLTGEAEAAGVEVRRLASGSFAGRIRELRRLIRSGSYDIVHTALFDADQLGRLAAWRTGVPVVSSFVNTPYEASRLADPNVTRWKIRAVQAIDAVTGRLLVDRFHAVSEGVKEANASALRVPLDRVTVAERGRDPEQLGTRTPARRREARRALGLDDAAPVVLNLGRQDHQKGQTVLIEAAEVLAATHPDLVVLIAGKEGSASADIARLVESKHGAAGRVRLLGHRSDVGELLCAADLLVVSSHFEGTAGAAVEAMALETPVVSTDVIGVRGILEADRNALLVPIGDARALAEASARVLDDDALASRLTVEGRRDFTARFTLDAAARRLLDLYESVLGPQAGDDHGRKSVGERLGGSE